MNQVTGSGEHDVLLSTTAQLLLVCAKKHLTLKGKTIQSYFFLPTVA